MRVDGVDWEGLDTERDVDIATSKERPMSKCVDEPRSTVTLLVVEESPVCVVPNPKPFHRV